jgi:hypothetical protein
MKSLRVLEVNVAADIVLRNSQERAGRKRATVNFTLPPTPLSLIGIAAQCELAGLNRQAEEVEHPVRVVRLKNVVSHWSSPESMNGSGVDRQ